MSTTLLKLEAARNACGDSLPYSDRCNYVNYKSLQGFVLEAERGLSAALGQHPRPHVLDLSNNSDHAFHTARSCAEYSTLRLALDVLERSPEVQSSVALIEPLVQEVRRLEAQLAAEELAAAQIVQARQAEIEAAKAAALAEVEARFAEPVVASPEPTPDIVLTRGKVKLETAAK